MRMHRVYISWTFIVNIYYAALVNTTRFLLEMGCSTCQMAWLSLEGCEDTEVRIKCGKSYRGTCV